MGSAEQHWSESLRLNPNQSDVIHMLGALKGGPSQSVSAHYVEQLYDEYAASFDDHLTGDLNYNGPKQIRIVLDTVLHTKSTGSRQQRFREKSLRVLDLGCGTGFSGVPFTDLAASIVGVDLSGQM